MLEPGPAFSRSQGSLWLRESGLVWEKGQTNLSQAQIRICSSGLCPQGLNQAQVGEGLNLSLPQACSGWGSKAQCGAQQGQIWGSAKSSPIWGSAGPSLGISKTQSAAQQSSTWGSAKPSAGLTAGMSRCWLSVTSQAPGRLLGFFFSTFYYFKALFQCQLLQTPKITREGSTEGNCCGNCGGIAGGNSVYSSCHGKQICSNPREDTHSTKTMKTPQTFLHPISQDRIPSSSHPTLILLEPRGWIRDQLLTCCWEL